MFGPALCVLAGWLEMEKQEAIRTGRFSDKPVIKPESCKGLGIVYTSDPPRYGVIGRTCGQCPK